MSFRFITSYVIWGQWWKTEKCPRAWVCQFSDVWTITFRCPDFPELFRRKCPFPSPIGNQYFVWEPIYIPSSTYYSLNFFSFAFEQGQTFNVLYESNYMFEVIFSLTLEKSSLLYISIRVSGNYKNNLQLFIFTLITLVT